DARLFDRGAARVIVAERLENDRSLLHVGGLEANLAGTELDVEPDVAGGLEGLGPHRRRPPGRTRGFCGRVSTLTSACPNGSWKKAIVVPPLSAAGVARQPVAGLLRRRSGGAAARERADDPRVHGDALTARGHLERALQRLGEPQR